MKLAALVIAVCLLGALLVQRQTLNSLRAENGTLQQQQAEAEQLRTDLSQRKDDGDLRDEIAGLKEKTGDLLALRNEITQLREQKAQLGRLRAENQRLRSAGPNGGAVVALPNLPGMFSKEGVTNAGWSTPEATIQTYFWALRERDENVRAACLEPSLLQQLQARKGAEGFQASVDENTNVIGFRILGQQPDGPDSVRVDVRLWMAAPGPERAGGVRVTPYALRLHKHGEEWRLGQ
ncbi:MAG TPA: hypothetical protein VN578_05395 [Candidatus Binatia bacterium]|jgi:hypothetical protein|nr:hypothetical protein [Candidatus Binatia bacterium]